MLQAESAGNDIDANEDEEEEEVQAGAAAVPNAEGEIAARENVWDEEDEIEQYFKEKAENGRGDEESDADSSGSESDEEYGNGGAKALGDNPSLEDLNAETQRILRGTHTHINKLINFTVNSIRFFILFYISILFSAHLAFRLSPCRNCCP